MARTFLKMAEEGSSCIGFWEGEGVAPGIRFESWDLLLDICLALARAFMETVLCENQTLTRLG